MKKKAAVALTLALALSPAWSDSATARLSAISLTYADLNPNDEYLPVTGSGDVGRFGEYNYYLSDEGKSGNDSYFGAEAGGTRRLVEEQRDFLLRSRDDWGAAEMQSDAVVNRPGAVYTIRAVRTFGSSHTLSIAPNTSITLTAETHLGVLGSANVQGNLQLSIGSESTQLMDYLSLDHYGRPSSSFEQRSGRLSVTYVNATDSWQAASASASIWIDGGTPPVPEPVSWALMLSGVLVIWRVAGRRRGPAVCRASTGMPPPATS